MMLKFADIYRSHAARRVFNVSMEGEVVLSKLNAVAKIGPNAAHDVPRPVIVTDGVFTISFQLVVGNAIVSGIAFTAK